MRRRSELVRGEKQLPVHQKRQFEVHREGRREKKKGERTGREGLVSELVRDVRRI